VSFFGVNPRNELYELTVHDIPDGSDKVDPFDQESERVWTEDDGKNILGTPLGSKQFMFS
jgi:hypothetical protein